jgi:enoyl-CoA hydratase/carnithine racemase
MADRMLAGPCRLPYTLPLWHAIHTSLLFLCNSINEYNSEHLHNRSLELARDIIANAPLSLRMAKAAINHGLDTGSVVGEGLYLHKSAIHPHILCYL